LPSVNGSVYFPEREEVSVKIRREDVEQWRDLYSKSPPKVTYDEVTIETLYGRIKVPQDLLEREGKEKITAAHVKSMMQLEELEKMEEQREKSNKSSDCR
jgi:hypothetical protein